MESFKFGKLVCIVGKPVCIVDLRRTFDGTFVKDRLCICYKSTTLVSVAFMLIM